MIRETGGQATVALPAPLPDDTCATGRTRCRMAVPPGAACGNPPVPTGTVAVVGADADRTGPRDRLQARARGMRREPPTGPPPDV